MMRHGRLQQAMLGAGVLGTLAWIVMAMSGLQVMPSYLAGWLFCLSLPLGALPLVMMLELSGVADWTLMAPLRRLLLLQPVVSLFALPVLLRMGTLYHRPGMASPPPAGWMSTGAFDVRMIVLLLIWTGLALIFSRQPSRGPRQGLAAIGLCVHFVAGTLAAMDWVMSLDPGLNSSVFGLIVISTQVSIALCVAILALALPSRRDPLPGEAAPLLLVVLGVWVFVHFIQYLIVWSGNLPTEIVWYQHRIGGLGGGAIGFGAAAALLALAILLPHRLARAPWVLVSVAIMLLLVHLIETLWLVTPGFHDRFTISLPDFPALLGIVGLAGGSLFLTRPAERKALRHDRP